MRFFGDARPKRNVNLQTRSNLARMRRYGIEIGHTRQQWLAVLEFQNFKCYYCRVDMEPYTWTRDHKTPLSRGGSDDISNIVAACRSCNSRKGTKTAEEFMNISFPLKKAGVEGELFFVEKMTMPSLSSVEPQTSKPKSEVQKTVEREVAAFEAQRNYRW